eukprot:TRINITY_DN11688_c0_g1_i2.p1 TRINITY_DN11688_c0_g1~~TRINITY_DN11688_c0_g1_i2.p1  ORF type:complete len:733 (-),score=140.77 TRINITY_DN11688_c0_g1_i2:561-2759(-)
MRSSFFLHPGRLVMITQGQVWKMATPPFVVLCPSRRMHGWVSLARRDILVSRGCGRTPPMHKSVSEERYGILTISLFSTQLLSSRVSEIQGQNGHPLTPTKIYCNSACGRKWQRWLWRRSLLLRIAVHGLGPASQPDGVGDGNVDGESKGVIVNGSFSTDGVGCLSEPSSKLLNMSTALGGNGDSWGWRKEGGEESGLYETAVPSDLLELEGVAVRRDAKELGDLRMPDIELEKIAESISAIERRNESIVQEMNDFTRVLAETAKALSARAQVARIEDAKLKKIARLQQADEVRRSQELRKAMDLRRIEEKRLEEIRSEQQRRQHALDEIIKKANTMAVGGVTLESSELPASPLGGRDSTVAAAPLPDVWPVADCALSEDLSDRDALGPDTVTLPESLECTITHPGALSCTKTTIRKDATRKTASVTMAVTTRCEGDACHSNALDVDDYVALGVQTLVEMAQELKQSRFQRATDADPVVYEKHRSLVNILKNGRVISAKPNEPPSKFGHESFITDLVDSRTGQKIEAMFKPRVEGDADGWHRAPVEYVAYELNLMLGMDYVPPVAYRKGGVVLGDRQFEEGAFIYYVSNTRPLKRVAAAGWGVSVARLLSDTRILDVLLNNSDRHHGHFLYGDHWADGKPRPVLIDHAAGFRKEAVVAMEHENAFQTGAVRCVVAKTYLRLRFLEKEMVASKFREVLSHTEISALMERRDQILSYLDQLVKERGYHRTVIEV